jgi:hypothetical protein
MTYLCTSQAESTRCSSGTMQRGADLPLNFNNTHNNEGQQLWSITVFSQSSLRATLVFSVCHNLNSMADYFHINLVTTYNHS